MIWNEVLVTCNFSDAEPCKICETHDQRIMGKKKETWISFFDQDRVKMPIYSSKYMEIRKHEGKW